MGNCPVCWGKKVVLKALNDDETLAEIREGFIKRLKHKKKVLENKIDICRIKLETTEKVLDMLENEGFEVEVAEKVYEYELWRIAKLVKERGLCVCYDFYA